MKSMILDAVLIYAKANFNRVFSKISVSIIVINVFFFCLQDVTNTKGNEFEDYCLRRPLLMGIFEKGLNVAKNV